MSTTDPTVAKMTRAELTEADARWPEVGSPWGAPPLLSWPGGMAPVDAAAELDRRSSARVAARGRLLALRGHARYTYRGRDLACLVSVRDGGGYAGVGGCWLGFRIAIGEYASDGCPSWTRDLRWFEPVDDVAREVLAFVALQIEHDYWARGVLSLDAGGVFDPDVGALSVPRGVHLRHLRAFLGDASTVDGELDRRIRTP